MAKAKVQERKQLRPYPRVTLEKALKIVAAIKEKNGGKPYPPDDVAKVIGIAQRSTNFQYTLAAARDFNLVEGSPRADTIGLTELGRAIAYAPNPETELTKKREAFLSIELFKRVLEHYEGITNLPEMQYMGNTLKNNFLLDEHHHEEFAKLLKENCAFLELGESSFAAGAPGESRATVVVRAEPKGNGQAKRAFVIMPFREHRESRAKGFFNEVLNALIVPAGRDAGFTVETANQDGSDVIQSTIINELIDADLVVADLTDHNPNVLFELGLRIALEKPVALIKASDTGPIFDVDNLMRVFQYSPNLWRTTIETELPKLTEHLRASWERRDPQKSYMNILRRQQFEMTRGG